MKPEKTEEKLSYICGKFALPGELVISRWISTGHINSAWYAALYDGREVRQYLVQKVNWYVYRDPVSLMRNIERITGHVLEKQGAPDKRRNLRYYRTGSGRNYLILRETEEGFTDLEELPEEQRTAALGEEPWEAGWEFWRLADFIVDSVSFESMEGDAEVLRMAGRAFGSFDRQLTDLDPSLLAETIPHFHDTEVCLDSLFAAAERDPLGRAAEAEEETELIRKYRSFAGTLCRKRAAGELPLRVVHNDTKTNNVLFDRLTHEPLVVIDLDNCMPGLVCCDFGDAVRFAACRADEARPGCKKLDLELFRAFAEGFLSELDGVLTGEELDSLSAGAAVITLELAARYLEDYLTGDRFFRIEYPGQNLKKAKEQLSLFLDMMLHLDDMDRIVKETVKKGSTDGAAGPGVRARGN